MQRRTFIHLSAYTAMAISLPFINSCKAGNREMAIAQPLFFSHLADVKTIKKAGIAYRKANPNEDNKKALTVLLLTKSNLSDSFDARAIQRFLDDEVENDFKAGEIVTINGWVLSLTEARQCALFSIIKS
jgi:tRNA G26 N,N-dimethylase Trm1